VPPDWADRLRGIQSVTDAALSMLDPQALLNALVERAREALQVDTAAILLLDRQSGQLVATAASGLEEEVQQGCEYRWAGVSPGGSRHRAARWSSTRSIIRR
jgi:GAF domain-containing protein